MTVDWTKPIELVDGTPARFSYTDNEGDIAVNIDGIEDGLARIYTTAGKHYYGKLPDIRNVIEPKTIIIDFQLPENRWAAEMACAESNAVMHVPWGISAVVPQTPSLYALALRILRTEAKPIDPLLLRAREIVASMAISAVDADEYRSGNDDGSLPIRAALAALKER